MREITEFAPAKINLTLEVLGRRADGYHQIRSLAAFAADVGDRLTSTRHLGGTVQVIGPFAGQIAGNNLVDAAMLALRGIAPRVEFPTLRLEKNLPVASGIGGGSADAAAALRLAEKSSAIISDSDIRTIAVSLGSDVPVCLLSKVALMTGTGHAVEPSRLPIDIFAVLVNPLIRVPLNKTAQVYGRLKLQPPKNGAAMKGAPVFFAVPDLVEYIQQRGNALEVPARELFPAIGRVATEVARLDGCLLAQLSGSGPTYFGLFASRRAAVAGADELSQRHPDWWVKSTRLI